jgi:c-di-GMP-binding flagellar brake protein YcgR
MSYLSQIMQDEKIQVVAYSGYRGDEIPRVIIRHNERIDVIEILDRWAQENLEDRTTKRFFKVKGSDGGIHKIFYDQKTAEWYYGR